MRRLLSVVLPLSFLLACRGSDPGSASAPAAPKTSASPAASTASAPDASTPATKNAASPVLVLHEEAPLAVQLLDAASYDAASLKRSVQGNLLLDARFDTFRVLAFPSKKKLAEGKGGTARWIAPSVVAFVEAKGGIAAVDVASEAKTKIAGGNACAGTGAACGPERLPVLDWASPDLEHAIVRSAIGRSLYDVRRTSAVALFAGPFEHGEAVATAVGPTGAACAVVGRTRAGLVRADADARPEPGTAELHCAEPAWAPPKKILELPVPDLLDATGLGGGAQAQFFGDHDVLVSLPVRATPSDARAEALRHCLVSLATGSARCTEGERPPWQAVGDGRYALEEATLAKPPSLVDVAAGRAHPIGTKPDPWRFPRHDARDPAKLVVERHDKTPDWRGSVVLP